MNWTPMRRAVTTALALGLTASTLAACDPPPTPIDIYSFAGRCHVLKDATSGRFVARDALGYTANASRGGATPFHMQATALGSYLFYGPAGEMPQVGVLDTVLSTTDPGVSADWK